MLLVLGGGVGRCERGLGQDFLPLRRCNREVECSRLSVDPGRKEHIGGPPQVGACGVIRARGKEVRLLERRIMAGSIREPADQISGSMVNLAIGYIRLYVGSRRSVISGQV